MPQEPLQASFASLGLSRTSLLALDQCGYEHPTPIQSRAIPIALTGADVIGCAATGTGKTAAFVLPMIERLGDKDGTRGLVLAPTRELALQIAEQVERLGNNRGFTSAVIIGGVSMAPQQRALRGKPHVVIATPGRLVDHLTQGTADLKGVEILVLDEADRMLDMGFKPQLSRILARLPKKRQTLLFSATMAGEVADFARANLHAPQRVEVARSGTTAARADQKVYLATQNEKTPLLMALLAEGEESTLVFCRTKRRADKLAKSLARGKLAVDRIHADRSQGQRKAALQGFKDGRYRVLVATDIAARGIDVAEIGHVVNFDLPHVPEDYVHRVGRTARASASGMASSFCAPEEVPLLKAIEKLLGNLVPRAALPEESMVFQEELARTKLQQAHPGPPQRHSSRPQGSAPGRHARSHPKKSGGGGGGGGSGGPPRSREASTPSSWSSRAPRGRR